MKKILLFGYGKMGSSIARGWIIKKLDFNFFIIEKEETLRKIATKDGFKAYQNIEHINETKNSEFFDIPGETTHSSESKIRSLFIPVSVAIWSTFISSHELERTSSFMLKSLPKTIAPI